MAIVMIAGLAFFFFPGRNSTVTPPKSTTAAETTPSEAASNSEQAQAPQQTGPKTYAAPPPFTIQRQAEYVANVETSKGLIRVALDTREAPNSSNNFVFLAKNGFYDGMPFTVTGDSVVAGDPTGSGSGGPGYTIPREDNGVKHGRGAISMLSSGDASNGSQFMIARQPMPALDGKQTIFGQIVDGLDVAGSLIQGDKILKITFEGP